MELQYTNAIPLKKWEAIIQKSKGGYFFHSPTWITILKESFGYENATQLWEINGAEILIPLMSKKNFFLNMKYSLPIGYGGLISESLITPEIFGTIFTNILNRADIFLKFTFPPHIDIDIHRYSNIQEENTPWNYTHIIQLDEYSIDKMREGTKRSIQKAEKSNIITYLGETEQDYSMFYSLYKEKSKEWGYNNPPLSWNFILNMYKYRNPNIKLRIALKSDEIIGGIVTFEFGKKIFYYLGATPTKNRKYCPLHMLIYETIKEAKDEGLTIFDMGASGNLVGTKQFKENFGAKEEKIKIFYISSHLGKQLLKLKNIL